MKNQQNTQLQSLREVITIPASLAIKHPLTNDDRQELKEALDSFLLEEGTEDRLTEAKFAPGKTKWSFPISRANYINENRRRYSRKLWERVIAEQTQIWDRSVGLADHPAGDLDASFKDSAVVWSNLRIEEVRNGSSYPLIWADAIFVGPHGKLAEEILEAGGRVGFSTAGLGELERMTETTQSGEYQEFYDVKPESFVLERPADLVPNPSQDVYGFLEMKKKEDCIDDEKTLQEGLEKTVFYKGAEISVHKNTVGMYTAKNDIGESIPNVPFKTVEEAIAWGMRNVDVYIEKNGELKENWKVLENEGVASASVGATSGDFQAHAPENVILKSAPGSKKKETGSEGDTLEEGSKKMVQKAPASPTGMTAYEERRYREDIIRFIEKAAAVENPKERLKEFMEIEQYVAQTPDTFIPKLKEQLYAAITDTKAAVEALFEKGEKFQQIFGTTLDVSEVQSTLNDLNTMRKTLTESTYDWKVVAEKMAAKLKTFVEAVEILRNRSTVEAFEALEARVAAISERHQLVLASKQKLVEEHQKKLTRIEKSV